MLNLSKEKIATRLNTSQLAAFKVLDEYKPGKVARLSLILFAAFNLIMAFLPWTQNIRSRGYVTTLHPDQRPQAIHSIIDGRIENWFVREGNYVKKGDTLVYISEIKDDYFDPELLSRTEKQIKAKELTASSYMEKVKALDNQIDALIKTRQLKIEQAVNKIQIALLKIESDSMDYQAAEANYMISERQLERTQKLYDDGLKSLTDLETKKIKLQETRAKLISQENKLLSSRNDWINAQVELASIDNQYKNKLAKAESEKYTALSSMYDAEAIVTKMQNQYMNYSIRRGLYFIVAPQEGYVTRTIRSGIGETIKAGEELLTVMPAQIDLAVSMYVRPMDLPLLQMGQEVRFMFDGWPSIVFSGWPGLSYGTFGGQIVAIDNYISENGRYRILVSPTPENEEWPEGLRVGSGAQGIALLKEVPIWYEVWRNLNGFPPDYYKDTKAATFQIDFNSKKDDSSIQMPDGDEKDAK
jgi:adhesin transport system membrane fusion protein